MTATVSIVGASGYGGGEALRLLLQHPHLRVAQITSRANAGKFAHAVHPNLRGQTRLQFTTPDQIERCDALLLAQPHTVGAKEIERWAGLADRIVDLSADFRLKDPDAYARWYGEPHPSPGWLDRFVYGLPETRRESLRKARYASGVGCNATAANLAILPLARAGLIERVVFDLKVGSSEGGAEHGPGSHHPERSGAMRTFAPTTHRHLAEVAQECGDFDAHFTATAVEAVRGVLCTAHVFTREPVDDKRMWSLYRAAYGNEPFVRIVREKTGLHRLPDPKILAGSNFCDVGWEVEDGGRRVVALSAIDNLVKGAAGSAIQCLNLMLGFEENAGLAFPGLHPI